MEWSTDKIGLDFRGKQMIPEGGIFDVMVMFDQDGTFLRHPVTHRGVLVRQSGQMLVATDQSGREVTTSIVAQILERVPSAGTHIVGFRVLGNNADSFARQNWVLIPAPPKTPAEGTVAGE